MFVLGWQTLLFSALCCHFQKPMLIFLINNIMCVTPCLSLSYPHNAPCWDVTWKTVWVVKPFELSGFSKLSQIFSFFVFKAISYLLCYICTAFFFLKGLHPHLFSIKHHSAYLSFSPNCQGRFFHVILCPSLISMEIYLIPALKKYLIKM